MITQIFCRINITLLEAKFKKRTLQDGDVQKDDHENEYNEE